MSVFSKVTIVGQAPGKGGGPVLGGRCGKRLADLAGFESYEERRALVTREYLDVARECIEYVARLEGRRA